MFDRDWHKEFSQLLDAHGATLMSMLRRLARSSHDAEDLFQETAARVWRNLPARPWLTNPRAWIMTIGYRTFLDLLGRRPKQEHESLQDPIDSHAASPEQLTERSEAAQHMQAAIAGLPQNVREVVILHYQAGLTLRQTARAMGLSPGTVKSRLNSALGQLRSTLS